VSKGNILAAIEVGSTKICTLVAEMMPDMDPALRHAALRILGVGITPAQGMRKGMVDNLQEATQAIRIAVEKAERSSGSRILSAHVSMSGTHIASLNNRGVATIPGRQRPIAREDIQRALEGAQAISIATNREVLHVIPRFFAANAWIWRPTS
jgi:cell division protein FtsA